MCKSALLSAQARLRRQHMAHGSKSAVRAGLCVRRMAIVASFSLTRHAPSRVALDFLALTQSAVPRGVTRPILIQASRPTGIHGSLIPAHPVRRALPPQPRLRQGGLLKQAPVLLESTDQQDGSAKRYEVRQPPTTAQPAQPRFQRPVFSWTGWLATGATRSPTGSCTACPAPSNSTVTQWVASVAACPIGEAGTNTWEREQTRTRSETFFLGAFRRVV